MTFSTCIGESQPADRLDWTRTAIWVYSRAIAAVGVPSGWRLFSKEAPLKKMSEM